MNSATFEAVVAHAAPALLGYFLHRADNTADAADLVSETLIAAWKAARKTPDDPEEARMWLFGVARNTLRHHVRSAIRRDALTVRLAGAISAHALADHDLQLDIRSAVNALPAVHAELVRLVHWDGFTIEDAAKHLGISASTARSRHARAKKVLKEALTSTPV